MPAFDDNPPPAQDLDYILRGIEANISEQTRRIDDLNRLLNGFTEQQFSAFDQSGQPFTWDVLARAAGAWPGINVPNNPVPFGVTIKGPDPTSGLYAASVYWDSSLLKNIVLNNTQTITGLADEPVSAGGDGNPNWFLFDYGNDLIWLEITLDGSGNTTAATINSYGLGGTWAPSDLPGEYGSGHGPFEYQLTYDANSNSIYTQYVARIAIFESVTSSTSPFPVSNFQLLNQNLLMEGDVYSGALYTTADGPATIGIVMPKPFAGPYITT